MHMYLPIAGNAVNIFVIFGLGGIVGLLSGIFGVGGGFLMTPLLIMMGIPPTVAAASDSNQIVGASTSATFAHFRLGRHRDFDHSLDRHTVDRSFFPDGHVPAFVRNGLL